MPYNIILITGKKQSGKDTLADYLAKRIGGEKYSFATPLKRFLVDVFGLKWEQCFGNDEEKNSKTHIRWSNLCLPKDKIVELYLEARSESWIAADEKGFVFSKPEDDFMTGREFMQVFGSNICRKTYSDCWVNATRNAIFESEDSSKIALIADVRFPNELEFFLDLDPIVIRLERNNYKSNHISETALDDYDYSKIKKFLRINNQKMSLDEKNETGWKFVLENLH